MRRVSLLAVAAVLLAAGSGNAQGIEGAATGLVAPVTTITFSELGTPQGTALTNQYALSGVTFTNLWQDPQPVFFPTPSAGNFAEVDGPISNPVSLLFSTAISGAAFNFITNVGTSSFEAFLGATSVHSFSVASNTGNISLWYGFEGIVFDRIVISAGGGNNAMLMDNLQIGGPASTVPEPATMTLLATGLAGLAGARRRKRNS